MCTLVGLFTKSEMMFVKSLLFMNMGVTSQLLRSHMSIQRVRECGIAMDMAAGKYKGKAPLKQELYKSGTKQVDIISQVGVGRTSEVKRIKHSRLDSK